MDEHFGAACQRTIGVLSITKSVVLLAICCNLLISVTLSAREAPETVVPNVLLIGLCHAVIIVVKRARCDNTGAREHSGVALLIDTVCKGPVQSKPLIARFFR